MGGEIFQLVMVYLFAAQCAIVPKHIVFKLSCRREIGDSSSIECVFATKPRHRQAISVTRSIVESRATAYGPPTTLFEAQVFISLYPTKVMRT
jgi:hypothetical protein